MKKTGLDLWITIYQNKSIYLDCVYVWLLIKKLDNPNYVYFKYT